MNTPQQPVKPTYKAPEQKPFKAAETEAPKQPVPPSPVLKQRSEGISKGWKPISSAPQAEDARFLVRATVNGNPVNGTETLVRYRKSRKMVGRRWEQALSIIDDKLGTKLGFRPTEWREPEVTDLKDVAWDAAIAEANRRRNA